MTMDNMNSHAVAVRPASYGRGTILASAADEARKSTQGRRMIRARVRALGKDSIYNLTGLIRTFPLQPQDLEPLENQFTYYTHFLGRAEELALHYTGTNQSAPSGAPVIELAGPTIRTRRSRAGSRECSQGRCPVDTVLYATN
jgi:hypothetical protein